MTETENLLAILAEECVETAQRATKAIRFGLDDVQEGQNMTNAEKIVYEFNDIVATMQLLQSKLLVPTIIDNDAISRKKDKIKKYTNYSKQKGIIT